MDNVLTQIGFEPETVTDFDRRVVRYVCECVSTRAAALAGAGVASLVICLLQPFLNHQSHLCGYFVLLQLAP